MLFRLLDEPLDVAPAHELGYDEWLAILLDEAENRPNVRMGSKPAPGPSLAAHPLAPHVVQAVGLDEGKGHVAVEQCIRGEIDLLLAAFAEEALDVVAAVA